MPLPEPAPRSLLHNRTIICEGFERDDGLWDIEAHLTDVKSYGFENRDRGTIGPGEPVHGMWLRLTLDEDFLIHGVEAAMDYTPFAICNSIAPSHVKLIGERIGPGWNRRVRQLLGNTQGCTHMREMLGRMATVAIQSMYGRRSKSREKAEEAGRKPFVIDGCHTWASDGPVVELEYPEWYKGNKAAGD